MDLDHPKDIGLGTDNEQNGAVVVQSLDSDTDNAQVRQKCVSRSI
jgi:hypothetical protein